MQFVALKLSVGERVTDNARSVQVRQCLSYSLYLWINWLFLDFSILWTGFRLFMQLPCHAISWSASGHHLPPIHRGRYAITGTSNNTRVIQLLCGMWNCSDLFRIRQSKEWMKGDSQRGSELYSSTTRKFTPKRQRREENPCKAI